MERLPLLDITAALKAMDGDREMYGEVVEVYLDSIPSLLDEMDEALRRHDLRLA